LKGNDVFEPMGFDAFGIHSENYALKVGEHPATLTARNVEYFREHQLKRLGLMLDWSHEVDTTDPSYYRWTQWVFLHRFKAVFTTRPDTIYGATFLLIGADHPNLLDFAAESKRGEVEHWRDTLPRRDENAEPDFALGIELGSRAVHPLTVATLPMWTAPYVLG